MSQTSYAFNMPLAVEGKIADSEFNLKEGTWVATEAIPFGRGVVKVVGEDDQIQLPDGTDNTFHGVSIMHQNDEQSFKWENVLMLTEHAMRNADKFGQTDDDGLKYIGLRACHQKLSPALIKTTMTCENLLKMQDSFELDSNI